MRRLFLPIVIGVAAASLSISGCSQATPASTSARAVATAAKGTEPTKSSSPTQLSEPAKVTTPATNKVDFPAKGKTITLIIPWAAGGPTDVGARLLAPLLERELGVPVQIVNKAGAGSQVGLTELVKAKPDGYTIAYANLPAVLAIYLDPERKSVFTRKDMQLIGLHVFDPGAVGVKADSPYKTMKDLIDAAKASPEGIKGATTGLWGIGHLALLQVGRKAGVEFSMVQFDGGGPAVTALLGGHVDSYWGTVGDHLTYIKSGQVRLLGVMDKQESRFAPGIKTLEALGYPVYLNSSRGLVAPAGTPKEIVDTLSAALKRATADEEHRKKMEEMSLQVTYMSPDEFTAAWTEYEALAADLMKAPKQ